MPDMRIPALPGRRWWLAYRDDTPVGPLWVGVAEPGGWARLVFGPQPPAAPQPGVAWQRVAWESAAWARYRAALEAYFAGEVAVPPGPWVWVFSSFTQAVYAAARRIPRGETRTYGALAAAIGRPRAARAVGQALARNPIPLVVPCHRVVAANGDLRGFSAAGGLALKARLLAWERGLSPAATALSPTPTSSFDLRGDS